MKTPYIFLLLTAGLFAAEPPLDNVAARDPEADRIFGAVIAKLSAAQSVKVDVSFDGGPEYPFQRDATIAMARPNLFRLEQIRGSGNPMTAIACDGRKVWRVDWANQIAYQRPARLDDFFHGAGNLVQYFFKPALAFDPTDRTWGRAVSIFDTNKDAYSPSVSTRYLGEAALSDYDAVKVVEVKFNTPQEIIRQVFYIHEGLILCLTTTRGDSSNTLHFRNYKFDERIPAEHFAVSLPAHIAVQPSEPVALGEVAPDFELPLNTGTSMKLKELLKNKKALLVVALDGAAGMSQCRGPDHFLAQMRLMQQVKDKFATQGLEVMAVVGGTQVTPQVKEQMLLNWMPDQARFSYPIALDLDLERGIQGSAFENFHLNGRNNILLDADGRVVFASSDLNGSAVNELALYQALAQIGFAVSPADLELSPARPRR